MSEAGFRSSFNSLKPEKSITEGPGRPSGDGELSKRQHSRRDSPPTCGNSSLIFERRNNLDIETLPAQLRRDEVAVGGVLGGVGVHHADEPLSALFRLGRLLVAESQLLEDGVEARQEGAIEGVVAGEEQRRGGYLVEDLVVGLLVGLLHVVVVVLAVGEPVVAEAEPATEKSLQ